MVCPGDESEQYGRMLLLQDFSFAGFTSTRTHFESNVLGPTSKQNCSHLCHLCLFHLSTTQASQLIQENHKIVPHFSPFHLSLSLSWPCPLLNCPFSAMPSIYFQSSHMKGPHEAPSSFTVFSHYGTTPQLQLVPL